MVRVTAIIVIVGTLLMAINQFEEVKNLISRAVSSVSNVAKEAYYKSDDARNNLATQLLKDTFPNLTPCNINSEWIEINNQSSLSQLLVTYQSCTVPSHCEELTKEDREYCVNDEYNWSQLYSVVFSKKGKKYIYAGEFETRATYSEIDVIGPYIVLYDRDDDRESVIVFHVLDGQLVMCGDPFDGGAYESKVSYFKESGLLKVKSIDGLYNISSESCAQPLRAELPKKITPSHSAIVLEIRDSPSGYPEVLLDGAVLPVDWKDGQWGAEGVGEITISPTDRIVTEGRCEFYGFQPFLGDMQRGFLLSESNNKAKVSNIECYSDDVSHSDSWASTYSWHLVLSVVP